MTTQFIQKGEEILQEYLTEPGEKSYDKEIPVEPINIMAMTKDSVNNVKNWNMKWALESVSFCLNQWISEKLK